MYKIIIGILLGSSVAIIGPIVIEKYNIPEEHRSAQVAIENNSKSEQTYTQENDIEEFLKKTDTVTTESGDATITQNIDEVVQEDSNEVLENKSNTIEIKRYKNLDEKNTNRTEETEEERFKRLYPSPLYIPEDTIGCDTYLPNFSSTQEEIYDRILPYYDTTTQRWLIDIWSNMRGEYKDEDISKATMQIEITDKGKDFLQQYIDQPERYYIRKIPQQGEYDGYSRYNIEVYDMQAPSTQLSTQAYQGLAKRRLERLSYPTWVQGYYLESINLYELEAMQKYIRTFSPQCGDYDTREGGPRNRMINIEKIIHDIELYGKGEIQDLVPKSNRFLEEDILPIESWRNGMLAFVYGLSPMNPIKGQGYKYSPISITAIIVNDTYLQILGNNNDNGFGFYYTREQDPSYNKEKGDEYYGRLVGPEKEDGSRAKIKEMPICYKYLEKNRDGVFDKESYGLCNIAIEEYIQNIMNGSEQSLEIKEAIEKTKSKIERY